MIQLTAENYNKMIKTGSGILIFLWDPKDPLCIVARSTIDRIDQMHGKDFTVAIVDITIEKEIKSVIEPDKLPTFVYIKDTIIKNKKSGLLTENELLAITR